MALRKEEITRKLLHLFALLMPAGIFYLPHENFPWRINYYIPVSILAFLFAGSVVVELLRFRYKVVQKVFYFCFGHLLRREETVKITGSTYVVGAALICSLLFRNYPHISFMVLTLFILGDAIAAIVGLSVGRIKIGKKSLEGSLACFTLCMILFYAAFPFLPWLLDTWNCSNGKYLAVALASSFSITIFELIPLKIAPKAVINDNLAVPVITGGLMLLLEKFFLN